MLALFLLLCCSHVAMGQSRAVAPSPDSAQAAVPSIDSVMAILGAYYEKRVTARAAAKVIVDYLVASHQPLNVQMDPLLQEALTAEMKRRKGS